MYNIEILRMQCEFLKDENSTIWFTYATNIAYRFIVEQVPEQIDIKKSSFMNKETR